MTPQTRAIKSKNLVDIGNKHYDDRNYPKALECAEQAIKEDRNNKHAWLLKGTALREMGRLHEAIECFTEAIKLDKRFYEAYIGNCAAYLALGENNQAGKFINEALEIHPRLTEAHGWKGFVAFSAKQYHTAISSYEKAKNYEKGKKSASIRNNYGDALFALERYDAALDYYADASDLDKKDAAPVIGMASIIMKIYSNKEESDKKIAKALELDPNAVYIYWIGLGISLQEEGKYEAALDYFDKAFAQDSLFKSLALINQGLGYLSQNDYNRSIDYFNSAIEDKSSYSAIAMICKSFALLRLNNFEEAAKCYHEANILDNDLQNSLSCKIIYPDTVGNLVFFEGYDTNLLTSLMKEAEEIFRDHGSDNPSDGPDDISHNEDKIVQDSFPEANQARLSDEELSNVQKNAEENGSKGESFINNYLDYLKKQGQIRDFEWTSKIERFSAYDFCIIDSNNERFFLDVKSTDGEFNKRIFVSIGELKQIAFGKERYDIYRIYEMNGQKAKLRIVRDNRALAKKILEVFEGLPEGVLPYSVSIYPASLQFDPEISLSENMGK